MIQKIIHDVWFSKILGVNSYKITIDENAEEVKKDDEKLFLDLLKKRVFMYSKVQTNQLLSIQYFEKHGFNLIDTNVTLNKRKEKKILPENSIYNINIRKSKAEDQNVVVNLARHNFIYTRFHLDPGIIDSKANEIKARWVENFYLGQRGDEMIVATDHDEVVGFLLLLKVNDKLIIDLIAVDKKYHGKGIASQMIKNAEYIFDYEELLVGTQITNIPSIRLYEKLEFQMHDSFYVFHYHN